MSFGSGYNGGRTRMGTKILLNVYDLSPANEYLYPIGMGLHHSGMEIDGKEYSYGSGGGIFDGPPKVAGPGAKFRIQYELGVYDGGTQELNKALDALRHDGGFSSDGYHLVHRNCNHFCNALSWKLLRKPIPPHINRLANIGDCCSCLLPKQLLEDSPVGNGSKTTSSFVVPTRASMNRDNSGSDVRKNVFAGQGHSLGGSTSTSSSSSSSFPPESTGLLSRWSAAPAASSSGSTVDDLTDRRERARKAALARLERNQQQQQQQQPSL